MSQDRDLVVNSGLFSEVLEAKIEACEGVFEEQHPFLRTAMRGLSERLGDRNVVPIGFVTVTELYVHDVNAGTDGFTGKPMHPDVLGLPSPLAGNMIRMTARSLLHETFGAEFAEAVDEVYAQITAPPTPTDR